MNKRINIDLSNAMEAHVNVYNRIQLNHIENCAILKQNRKKNKMLANSMEFVSENKKALC